MPEQPSHPGIATPNNPRRRRPVLTLAFVLAAGLACPPLAAATRPQDPSVASSHLLEPWGFVPASTEPAEPAATWPGIGEMAATCLADGLVQGALDDYRFLLEMAHRSGLEWPADPGAMPPGSARTLAEAIHGARFALECTALHRLTDEIQAIPTAWERAGHDDRDLLRYEAHAWQLLEEHLDQACEEVLRAAAGLRVDPPAPVTLRPPVPGAQPLPDLLELVEASLGAERVQAALQGMGQEALAWLATGADPEDQAASREAFHASWDHFRHMTFAHLNVRLTRAERAWLDAGGCELAMMAHRHQAYHHANREMDRAEDAAFRQLAQDHGLPETSLLALLGGASQAGPA